MKKNRVVFLTGAGSGLGKDCAKILAENDFRVFLVDNNKENLEDLTNLLNSKKKVAGCSITDIKDVTQVNGAVEKCMENFGTIDILINNAAILRTGLLSEMKISDWDDVIKTNLSGFFYTTRAILPIMLKNKKGHILNVGSSNCKNALPRSGGYDASKFGVKAFTDVLSKEVVKSNIKVTLFNPAGMYTPIHDISKDSLAKKERERKYLNTRDVAEIILFILTRPDSLVIDEIYFYSLNSPYKCPIEG